MTSHFETSSTAVLHYVADTTHFDARSNKLQDVIVVQFLQLQKYIEFVVLK